MYLGAALLLLQLITAAQQSVAAGEVMGAGSIHTTANTQQNTCIHAHKATQDNTNPSKEAATET